MPSSKLNRDELINDLTVYAKLLNESEWWTKSFEHVYELVSADEYAVSLHTFFTVMSRIPLTPFQQERFTQAQVLLDWTHPHIPDFAPFSALWHLITVKDEADIWVEIEDESTTTIAVQTLFSQDEQSLIDCLDHECVLVRAAATISAIKQDFYNGAFHAAIDSRPNLQLELALYYGTSVNDYVYSSQFKDAYEEALENFSGDSEDLHLLPDYPSLATECRCIEPQAALNNYFASLQMFWLNTEQFVGAVNTTDEFAVWSTRQNHAPFDEIGFDERTFFSVALPTKTRMSYQIKFAYGALVVAFETIAGHPNGDWKRWLDGWDEHIDMFQSFFERFGSGSKHPQHHDEHRKYVWHYHEEFTNDGAVQVTHKIMKINETRDAYTTIEPIDFDSGFYFLRRELFNI